MLSRWANKDRTPINELAYSIASSARTATTWLNAAVLQPAG
jgi:hypothetical protein